jgi:hypothetical protein
MVEWRGDVAHCVEPGCQVTSDVTGEWIREAADIGAREALEAMAVFLLGVSGDMPPGHPWRQKYMDAANLVGDPEHIDTVIRLLAARPGRPAAENGSQ